MNPNYKLTSCSPAWTQMTVMVTEPADPLLFNQVATQLSRGWVDPIADLIDI